MRCMKCGQTISGTIADSLGHVCAPSPHVKDGPEHRTSVPRAVKRLDHLGQLLQRAAESAADGEEIEEYEMDDLDRQILLANQRDFGAGAEQGDRFQDSHRYTPDGRPRDRTGSALLAEAEAGGTPAFDAASEVPNDTYDRAEFLAREMRFPSEQLAYLKEKPLDRGLVSFQLVPAEIDEYLRTGKMPAVPDERRHHAREMVASAAPKAADGPSL